MEVSQLGIDPDRWYHMPKGTGLDRQNGIFAVNRRLSPWAAETLEVRAI
jgi:hypothetical protein